MDDLIRTFAARGDLAHLALLLWALAASGLAWFALRELAASARLAGDHGARLPDSLSAKADSPPAHQTAMVEARAEAATEKMLLPVVALVVGMILFVGYGVVEAISTPTVIP